MSLHARGCFLSAIPCASRKLHGMVSNNIPVSPSFAVMCNIYFSTCMGALWNCKNLDCPGECSVVGDSHYTTFDGLLSKIYGECQYIFAKDCTDSGLFS